MGGLEGLVVAVTAAHREHATVLVDHLHRELEQLRLGHELDLAAQVDGHEEVIEEGEVVRSHDRRTIGGHLVRVDRARAEEEQQVGREHQANCLVHPVRPLRARALVEVGEVLRRPLVLINLRLEAALRLLLLLAHVPLLPVF